MAEAVRLGRMTDTMEEGFLAEVSMKVGDKVKSGDTLAEIETDKATLPLESYVNGTVLFVAAKKGDTLKIGDLIGIIGKEGEDYSGLLNGAKVAEPAKAQVDTAAPAKKEEVKEVEVVEKTEEISTTSGPERLKASPLARVIAKEKGIDLTHVKGSGEEGRIIKRDLEQQATVSVAAIPQFTGKEGQRDVRVSQMRKAIAKRLLESKNSAPHFYLTYDINMDAAIALRTQLNAIWPAKVSFNDFVIKAVALALRQNPNINCSWLGDTIRYYDHIHIGMAVAVEDGLLVPVIKFADGKSMQQISVEAKAFAEKATSKKIMPQDMEGNTFTISNLGMFGIDEFTAIINPPDACILAVGGIRQEPGVVNGEIKVVNKMKVTMSCDHRVVDGASGSKFLQSLKKILEEPLRLLL